MTNKIYFDTRKDWVFAMECYIYDDSIAKVCSGISKLGYWIKVKKA